MPKLTRAADAKKNYSVEPEVSDATTVSVLQDWYASQCDGDWEHRFGVRIETLDNPGWRVKIDLAGTPLENKLFAEVSVLDPDNDPEWIHCRIAYGAFHGAGGPGKLDEILRQFLAWAGRP